LPATSLPRIAISTCPKGSDFTEVALQGQRKSGFVRRPSALIREGF
jgi:hypothetical protein